MNRYYSASEIASIAHEANRQLQVVLGEAPFNEHWLTGLPPELMSNTQNELQRSAKDGVTKIMSGEVRTPEESHENWLRHKSENGWTYGPTKDFEAKTHPCMVPYHELPAEQKTKDALFFAIVNVLLEANEVHGE